MGDSEWKYVTFKKKKKSKDKRNLEIINNDNNTKYIHSNKLNDINELHSIQKSTLCNHLNHPVLDHLQLNPLKNNKENNKNNKNYNNSTRNTINTSISTTTTSKNNNSNNNYNINNNNKSNNNNNDKNNNNSKNNDRKDSNEENKIVVPLINDNKINELIEIKKNYFFRFFSEEIRKQLTLDHVASYSVTETVTANKISNEILKCFNIYNNNQNNNNNNNNNNLIITDATACIGGNVFSFSKMFKKVYAIENNIERYNMLKNNIKILKLDNIYCIMDDYIKIMLKLKQDIVFIDPPWGGIEYHLHNKIKLNDIVLSGYNMVNICNLLSKHNKIKLIALKLPINYDINQFKNEILKSDVPPTEINFNFKLRKILFIILDYRKKSIYKNKNKNKTKDKKSFYKSFHSDSLDSLDSLESSMKLTNLNR